MYHGPDVFDINQPLNKQWRFSHEDGCRHYGEGPDYRERLYIRRTHYGWLYYCHNCGASGCKPYSASELLKTILHHGGERPATEHLVEETKHGLSFTHFSRAALDWLYQYDITDNEIDLYGIKYTVEYGGRVAIPVHSERGTTVGYQLRRLDNSGPKYITKIINDKKGTPAFRIIKSNKCVVVEDALSAIKVSRQGVSAIALMGSPNRIPTPLAKEIEARFDVTAFWLDPDKSDRGILMAEQMLRMYRGKYLYILGDRDPKEFSDAELKQIIGTHFALDLP